LILEPAGGESVCCARIRPRTAPSIADPAVKVQHSVEQSPELLEAVDDMVCTRAQKQSFCEGGSDGNNMATSRFPRNHSV
jgi:hypothetical protein